MNLAWFSPLPPDHTEIGNVTARMVPSLSTAFDLTVYTEREDWSDSLNASCPVKHFKANAIDWKALHSDGMPVYHIGNNIHFHGEIIQAARKCPGIVVMHDLRLHETIMNLCLYKGAGRSGYFDILHKYGGSDAVEVGKRYLEEHKPDMAAISSEYPLHEYVLENTAGVITYNPLNVETIRKATPAPVQYAPLPFLSRSALHPEIHRKKKPDGQYKIVIFGFLGSPNRRLRPFLEAFSRSASRNSYELVMAGKYDAEAISQWTDELGIKDRVRMEGYLTDEALDKLLEESDLTVNLRWPSMGESSATLLRLWNYSLPSLVTRTAFYSTLPEDVVAFVDPDREEADIHRHLNAFVKNPETYYAMGLKGRARLESLHSIEASIDYLKQFIPEVVKFRGSVYPQTFGRNLARNYFGEYTVPEVRNQLIDKCAEELATWTGAEPVSTGNSTGLP